MSAAPGLDPRVCDYPEIETGLPTVEQRFRIHKTVSPTETSIDILEFRQDATVESTWIPGLDHDKCLAHFQKSDSTSCALKRPASEILFMNAQVDPPKDLQVILVSPVTLDWLRKRFGFSHLFSDCLLSVSKGAKTGDSYSVRTDDAGKVVQMSGFYRQGNNHGAVHIWFSFTADESGFIKSQYVIGNCPPRAKERILACTQVGKTAYLLQPFIIDCFIADERTWDFKEDIVLCRTRLANHEQYDMSGASIELHQTFASLHRLSQIWIILHEDIVDFEGRAQFLVECAERVNSMSSHPPAITKSGQSSESLRFLLSRTMVWKRWVANYNARTRDRIDLFFNLATQMDSKTNLEIASVSKNISEENRRDSLSMITIAAVTMAFLPGSFVTSLFSMVFFQAKTDESGRGSITLLGEWWLFPVISVPLTLIVFAIWLFWSRMRGIKEGLSGHGRERRNSEPDDTSKPDRVRIHGFDDAKDPVDSDIERGNSLEHTTSGGALMLREKQLITRRV